MYRRRTAYCAVLLAFAFACHTAVSCAAEEQPNLDQQIEKLQDENAILRKRLRLEQLQKENAGLRRQLVSSSSRTRIFSSPAVSATSVAPARGMYMMATPAIEQHIPSWNGPYIGASFGVGFMSTNEQDNNVFSSFSASSGFVSQSQETSIGQLSGHDFGAIGSFSLGYNWLFGSRLIAGLEVEGSLSSIAVHENGTLN